METCPYSHEAYRMDIAAKAEITCLAIRVCPTFPARADLCFSCVLLRDTALALLSLLVMGQRNGRAFQGQDTCSWQHVTNVTLHSACAAGQLEERSQYPFLLSNRHRWASMQSSTFSISSADAWDEENRAGFCGKLDNHFREKYRSCACLRFYSRRPFLLSVPWIEQYPDDGASVSIRCPNTKNREDR